MDADVVVVGGGPVGLGLAIDLAQRGVTVTVVERHRTIQPIPKGQNLTQRSDEHFRCWGVTEAIKARSPIPPDKANGGLTCYGTLLSGYHFNWFQRQSVREFYAADSERLPQYETEAALRERLAQLPNARLLSGWTFVAVSHSHDSVQLTLSETDGTAQTHLTAHYAVGCDGARSSFRGSLGVGLTIDDPGKKMVLLTFRSPRLDQLVAPLGPKAIYKVLRPGDQGYWNFFGRVDLDAGWFFHAPVALDATEQTYDFASHLAAAVGAAFDLELTHVGFWDLRFAHAEAYRDHRLFLAGDAAHSHPPYGGYGINTGFEDARNLSWKLAAELAGWAGPHLLDSYHDERHPVFASTRDQFIAAYIRNEAAFLSSYDPQRDREAFERAWSRMAQSDWDVSRYCPNYRGSAIVRGATAGCPSAVGEHTLQAQAGCHLPPRKLADGSPVYDRLGSGFSLIAIDQPPARIDGFRTAAARRGVPLTIIPTAASPQTDEWRARILLVRPDHFVGYCSDEADAIDPDDVLRVCTGQELQRPHD